jgi:methylaspartate mutase epsilon subunit
MHKRNQLNILLAGIGGDSHSVGLILLRQAIQLSGYNVKYLGTQNDIQDVVANATGNDAVLISCMDGHAHHYLRDFPKLKRMDDAIWYLGGNPSVLAPDRATRLFLGMGFSRVFLQFVDVASVIAALEEDLCERIPAGAMVSSSDRPAKTAQALICLDNRIADIDHDFERGSVLLHWHTGAAVRSLSENATFLAAQPNFASLQKIAHIEKRTIVQPRCGVADENEQLKIFQKLAASGAGVLSYQIDSLTRNNNYSGAQEAIAESRRSGRSTLNGFPLVNHGINALRQIARRIDKPLQCRHSTKDPRLLAEICFAGGVTAFEGGSICYNLPYYKDYPVAQSIHAWKYVDRLAGRYFDEFGITIDREFFGVLTATLISPSLAISTGILEAALAAKQGVKAISIGYAEQGNRIQDVAAIKVIPKLTQQFFSALNLNTVQISTVFHQYMSAFPEHRQIAEQLIRASSTTAALSRATRILTKTSVEALRIPTAEDNASSLRLIREGFELALPLAMDHASLASEMKLIEEETIAILDSVLALGRGDLAQGTVKAIERGMIDVPFSPSIHNAGRAITARDATGAIRFLDTGSLPFSKDVRQFHAECMAERSRRSNIPLGTGYKIVEKDVLCVPRGEVPSWPINENTITRYATDGPDSMRDELWSKSLSGGAS